MQNKFLYIGSLSLLIVFSLVFASSAISRYNCDREKLLTSFLFYPVDLPEGRALNTLFVDCNGIDPSLYGWCLAHNEDVFSLAELYFYRGPVSLNSFVEIILRGKSRYELPPPLNIKHRYLSYFKAFSNRTKEAEMIFREASTFENSLDCSPPDVDGCLVNLSIVKAFLPLPIVMEFSLNPISCKRGMFYSKKILKEKFPEYFENEINLLRMEKKLIVTANTFRSYDKNCSYRAYAFLNITNRLREICKDFPFIEKTKALLNKFARVVPSNTTTVIVSQERLFGEELGTMPRFCADLSNITASRGCPSHYDLQELNRRYKDFEDIYLRLLEDLKRRAYLGCIFLEAKYRESLQCKDFLAEGNEAREIYTMLVKIDSILSKRLESKKQLSKYVENLKGTYQPTVNFLIEWGKEKLAIDLLILLDDLGKQKISYEEFENSLKKLLYRIATDKEVSKIITRNLLLKRSLAFCNGVEMPATRVDLQEMILNLPQTYMENFKLEKSLKKCTKPNITCSPKVPELNKPFLVRCILTAINPTTKDVEIDVNLPYPAYNKSLEMGFGRKEHGNYNSIKLKLMSFEKVQTNITYFAFIPAEIQISNNSLTVVSPYSGRVRLCISELSNIDANGVIFDRGVEITGWRGCNLGLLFDLKNYRKIPYEKILRINGSFIENNSDRFNVTLKIGNKTIILHPKEKIKLWGNVTEVRPKNTGKYEEVAMGEVLPSRAEIFELRSCEIPQDVLFYGLSQGLPEPYCGRDSEAANEVFRKDVLKMTNTCSSFLSKGLYSTFCERATKHIENREYLAALYYLLYVKAKENSTKELVLDILSLAVILGISLYFYLTRKKAENTIEI